MFHFKLDQLDSTMSLGEHLEELRTRLLLALIIPLPVSIIAFFFSETLLEYLLLPLNQALAHQDLPQQVQVLTPSELLITQLKISIIAGLLISSPWVLWQFWLFVRPGLYAAEQRFVYFLLPGSAILTTLGVALMYFAMLPLMLIVLVGMGTSMGRPDLDQRVQTLLEQGAPVYLYQGETIPDSAGHNQFWMNWPGQELSAVVTNNDTSDAAQETLILSVPRSLIAQQFQISTTVNFILLLFLGIVLAFQMPLVLVLLGWVGLASPQWLRKQRKYALLVCAVLSAIITPADALSMVIMLLPLYGLYELGILLMTIAPASKIAKGSVFAHSGRSENTAGHADNVKKSVIQEPETAQPESTVPRQPTASPQTDQSARSNADDGGADS